jgi:hypothetical protein
MALSSFLSVNLPDRCAGARTGMRFVLLEKNTFPDEFLTGDWTHMGLPVTIEGACLSGHLAAEKVQEYLP